MAKNNNPTVTAPSIISAFFFALLIEVADQMFSISRAIGPVFSDILFSILYSICIISLFIPLLRRHRSKSFSWKVFLAYVVPGFIIIFLGLPTDQIIVPFSWTLYESLTLTRLIAAVLFGAGVIRAVVAGSKEDESKKQTSSRL